MGDGSEFCMKIIIVGCGQVGETLAAELGGEGNNITVIDLSSTKVNAITSKLDVMGVVGNGATPTIQKEAGIDTADLLIAVTNSDELNLLCCMIAKRHGKCRVIARLQNPEYSSESAYLKDELGLAMVINPEHAAAEEIARVLRFPAANKIETFAKGRVELLKFRLPENSSIIGLSVKDVVIKLRCDVLVCTVERENETYIANGDFVFEGRDVVSIISSPKKAANFFKKINMERHSTKNVIIVGAGETSHYLCETLRKSGMSIKVIDNDLELCENFSSIHEEVTVIHGDETDRELLVEEGISDADAFVAMSDYDEQNIFLSLFAKNSGKVKIVTKINKPEYDDIIKYLDIDTTVYPKSITSDMIVRYVRAMKNLPGSNVETMYNFIKGEVEATEFIVRESSPIIDTPLSKLKFKENVLVAAILRDKSVIIPRGNDMIKPGDAVVIVSKILGLGDISDVIVK